MSAIPPVFTVVPAKRQRLSEDVAEQITRYVIAHGLQPGDRLPTEPELVEQYEVSRTVVREAGRLLVERGLVDIRPGRGMVVADFDGSSIARQYGLLLELKQGSFRQLMEMRLVLEVGVAEYAAQRRTSKDLERIQAALDSFATTDEHDSSLEADLEFHTAIAHASHNPFFSHVVVPVNDYLRRAYQPSLGYEAARPQTLAEHEQIAQAIDSGDAARAGELMRRHLGRILAGSEELVQDADAAPVD
ncbi:FadR/GntR family transcriptional regulator [Blastococcus sp. PRF04-17]|uniref:FadR/GntR family transcriptional regulator n=1 Tax=Blastococcus sp. PRF04-17 TaxID=2933797 RepID=UPI001FF5864A|nr:FadR/GntR family transcriptional regulator [Blastococcus sp. PRF04-17]UOY03353.1 FadR family transcriptional regulator [Blastococcus sp. PRF04-17]